MRTTVNPFIQRHQSENAITRGKRTPEQETARLREVAKEFEGIMMEQMVREMRKAVPKSELLGRETGQELFNEMLDGEFVKLMVERGGIGLARFIENAFAPQEKNTSGAKVFRSATDKTNKAGNPQGQYPVHAGRNTLP